MSWVEKNWKPLTVVGGLLGLSWFAGKRFEEAETFSAELEDCYVCDGYFNQVYVCDNDCGFQCCEADIDGNLIPIHNDDGTINDYCITCYEEKYGAETFDAEWRGRWNVGELRQIGWNDDFTFYVKKESKDLFSVQIKGRHGDVQRSMDNALKQPIFRPLKDFNRLKIGLFYRMDMPTPRKNITRYIVHTPQLLDGAFALFHNLSVESKDDAVDVILWTFAEPYTEDNAKRAFYWELKKYFGFSVDLGSPDDTDYGAETFEAPYGRMPAWRRGKRQWNKNHLVWASDSKAVREAIKTAFPEQKFSVRIVKGEYIEVVAKSGTRPADVEQFREDVKRVAMTALGEIYKDSPEELREKSVYVYASPRDFGAETFEAYDPMMQNRIDRNECSHSYDDGDSRGGDAWVLKYADLMGVEDGLSYIEAGVKCGICGQERIGSWGINEGEGFQITKGEEGRMPRFYGFYGAEPNEMSE